MLTAEHQRLDEPRTETESDPARTSPAHSNAMNLVVEMNALHMQRHDHNIQPIRKPLKMELAHTKYTCTQLN